MSREVQIITLRLSKESRDTTLHFGYLKPCCSSSRSEGRYQGKKGGLWGILEGRLNLGIKQTQVPIPVLALQPFSLSQTQFLHPWNGGVITNHSKGCNGVAHTHEALSLGQGDVHKVVSLTYLHQESWWEAHRFCGGKDGFGGIQTPLSVFCVSVEGDFMKPEPALSNEPIQARCVAGHPSPSQPEVSPRNADES